MSQSSLDIVYSNLITYQVLNNCNIGIGKENPSFKLDVNGDINFTSGLKLNGCNLPFSFYTNTNVIASNAFFSYINNCNNFAYYQYLVDGLIRFPQTTSCDVICVGAGGNGGLGSFSGGGGAGEVIVYPSFNFNSNINYNIQVGLSSFNSNMRISRISSNNTDLIRAAGGGDGGTIGFNISNITNINNISGTNDYYCSFSNVGTTTIRLNKSYLCDILVVGGGGAGGGNTNTQNNFEYGGGGAGGYIYQTNVTLNGDLYQITTGNGGINSNGGNSSIIGQGISYIAIGGGRGGWLNGSAGNSGGSGGGGANNGGSSSGTTGQGNAGAAGASGIGGGGGGAGAAGSGRNGGNGLANTITGVSITYAGGGGGSFTTNGIGGTGGGGNSGQTGSIVGKDGTNGLGGGGGGAFNNLGSGTPTAGGKGGSGIVIIRFKNILTTQSEIPAKIGGSGGGGTYINNSNTSFGTSFNPGYSNMTAGSSGTSNMGGNGGSATLSGGLIETITGSNLILGIGGSGATSNSIPNVLGKISYGSGGDGNGGFGTQGTVIIRVPLNIQKPIFNGYIDYNNIDNKPYINTILNSKELIDVGYFNQINFPMANVAWANEWFLYMGLSPSLQSNSFIFWHNNSNSGINSKWWFNGTIANTNNEISDGRVKKEINEIQDPISKLMTLKPKEYYLCDDKDYLKKYGIIAQDVKQVIPELVYTDTDYIANIYSKCNYSYEIENNRNLLLLPLSSSLTSNININDELKLLLDNNDGNNQEIIIEDLPYHNRYKKRYVKVKEIIDERTIEIYEKLELTEIEKENLFIYGKKTNDFLKLDYSSIYTLNVASTQELFKIIEEQNKKISNLENLLNTAIIRINNLESNINIY
jgi:Chaperone of endosialidase